MATVDATKYLQEIREYRSSESNFETLCALLTEAKDRAKQNNEALAKELAEVDETYVSTYQKAKETGGSAWPEFEKFVTAFERALTGVGKE